MDAHRIAKVLVSPAFAATEEDEDATTSTPVEPEAAVEHDQLPSSTESPLQGEPVQAAVEESPVEEAHTGKDKPAKSKSTGDANDLNKKTVA